MAYKTKQRELIIDFFESHPDVAFSASEIAKAIKGSGISLSAIYRNLAELEKDKRVRKSVKQGAHVAYYRYLECHDCHGHIHMYCVECGKTSHLGDEGATAVIRDVLSSSDFALDKNATVLYGVCRECQQHHQKGERK